MVFCYCVKYREGFSSTMARIDFRANNCNQFDCGSFRHPHTSLIRTDKIMSVTTQMLDKCYSSSDCSFSLNTLKNENHYYLHSRFFSLMFQYRCLFKFWWVVFNVLWFSAFPCSVLCKFIFRRCGRSTAAATSHTACSMLICMDISVTFVWGPDQQFNARNFRVIFSMYVCCLFWHNNTILP